jgi:hypothetical protein
MGATKKRKCKACGKTVHSPGSDPLGKYDYVGLTGGLFPTFRPHRCVVP